MKTVCLSTAYLAPISYYRQMLLYDTVLIEQHENYVKQTYRNRACIMTASGIMPLTIPVEHHGGAYDKSPFFEYYADDFRPFYESKPTVYLLDYNMRLQQLVCDLINLHPAVSLTTTYQKDGDFLDLRNAITPKRGCSLDGKTNIDGKSSVPEYYQVFAQRHGFTADLSIVDLLFNMGPEALLTLHSQV